MCLLRPLYKQGDLGLMIPIRRQQQHAKQQRHVLMFNDWFTPVRRVRPSERLISGQISNVNLQVGLHTCAIYLLWYFIMTFCQLHSNLAGVQHAPSTALCSTVSISTKQYHETLV